MERIAIFSNEKRKNYYFSRVNLLLGYSGSGKTTILDDLESIFNGKRKGFLLDGIPIKTNDVLLFKIDSFEDISPHLKLNSKSLIRKYLLSLAFSDEFQKDCNQILDSIKKITLELSLELNRILPEAELEIPYENLLDLILDTSSISTKDESHYCLKKGLFQIIDEFSKNTNKKTIILMDDFDSSIDEESLLAIFNQINNTNAYFFLTSSKPLPQQLLTENTSIYGIRNSELIPFPNIRDLISSSIESQPMYLSFEQYMLSKGYVECSGILENYIKRIQEDQCSNLMRILTSRNPIISPESIPGKVCIIPKSEEEERIYKAAIDILNCNSY